MKNKTVSNLIIGTAMVIGVGLTANFCLKIINEKIEMNKKRINKIMNDRVVPDFNSRVYHTIGTFPLDDTSEKHLTK